MELFLHNYSSEKPVIREVEATSRVRELVIDSDPDEKVWIEEVDDDLDLDLTIEEAGIRDHNHIHIGRCHHVEVKVRYNSDEFIHEFGPGTKIKTVYHWASGPNAANLSTEQIAKHGLVVPGSDYFLSSDIHVGSLIDQDTCSVCLDLVPLDRFAG